LGVIAGDQVLLWMAVAGVAAVLASHPAWFAAVQWAGAAYLAYLGLRLLLAREGSAPPIRIEPRQYARQALVITLLNPKAIVFYMAFFPMFIDPAHHQGLVTFGAMALTIASITAAYCFILISLARLISERVSTHKQLGRWLEKAAGACMIGFGLKLGIS
jgi:threonine/homoserine/homoserine lactone efflux protein